MFQKIAWFVKLFGVYAREFSRLLDLCGERMKHILARITLLYLCQISNASVWFSSKIRFIVNRCDC